MDGAAWRRVGRDLILEPWLSHMEDRESGLVHNAYDDDFAPKRSDAKIPWVMARQAFGLCAGYLMYADPRLTSRAREILDWLAENAWDEEYGGWFEKIRADGTVVDDRKTEFNQLYVDTGLAFSYLVTGDEAIRTRLDRSREFALQAFADPTASGTPEFFRELARDGSVRTDVKDFVGHIVPLSGPGLYRYLATRDRKVLDELRGLLRVVTSRMRDPEHGWILERFDADWNYLENEDPEKEVDIGHNLEFSWVALRVSELIGDDDLRRDALELAARSFDRGFVERNGMWLYKVARDPNGAAKNYTHWWVQEYGTLMSLVLYAATGEARYLEVFQASAAFWRDEFLDPEKGDCHLRIIDENGTLTKEKRPNSSYHSLEFVLLVSLHLDLYVNRVPAQLHFRSGIGTGHASRSLTVLEDDSVRLDRVEIAGEQVHDVDPDARTARIPAGEDRDIVARLAPSRPGARVESGQDASGHGR